MRRRQEREQLPPLWRGTLSKEAYFCSMQVWLPHRVLAVPPLHRRIPFSLSFSFPPTCERPFFPLRFLLVSHHRQRASECSGENNKRFEMSLVVKEHLMKLLL